MAENKVNVYHDIGEKLVRKCISEFYDRAFSDLIIGHFFFEKDKADLTEKQIRFASVMLGDKSSPYSGKDLGEAHKGLLIGGAHFRRRQVIMKEVLMANNVPEKSRDYWLMLEDRLRALVQGSGVELVPSCEESGKPI